MNQIDLLSNEDIQQTFRDFKDNQIISCVNYFPEAEKARCHVYSYPFTMRYYYYIANNFPGGLFECVHEVSLYDEHPFEHEFFLQIAQSFPSMERLSLINWKQQQKKRCKKSKDDNQDLSIIKYRHLTELMLCEVHDDYVEQFLDDTKICLPNNVCLHVNYKSLRRVTHHFTRDSTRINCSKIERLYLFSDSKIPKRRLKDYFPHTEISS